jgi:hypothetical protein
MHRGDKSLDMDEVPHPGLRYALDWNLILREINDSTDVIVEALRAETARQRADRIHAAEEAELEPSAGRRHWTVALRLLSRSGRSAHVAETLVDLFLSASAGTTGAHERPAIYQRLATIALALDAYRAEHGEYPASLEAVPSDRLPVDPYSGEPFRYRRTEAGCVIYSVGPNGQDDDGWHPALDPPPEVAPRADDLPLHLPPPLPEME